MLLKEKYNQEDVSNVLKIEADKCFEWLLHYWYIIAHALIRKQDFYCFTWLRWSTFWTISYEAATNIYSSVWIMEVNQLIDCFCKTPKMTPIVGHKKKPSSAVDHIERTHTLHQPSSLRKSEHKVPCSIKESLQWAHWSPRRAASCDPIKPTCSSLHSGWPPGPCGHLYANCMQMT